MPADIYNPIIKSNKIYSVIRQKTKDEERLNELGDPKKEVYSKYLPEKVGIQCMNERSLKLVQMASKQHIDEIKKDIKSMTNAVLFTPKTTKNATSTEFSLVMRMFLDEKFKYKRIVRTTSSITFPLTNPLHFHC